MITPETRTFLQLAVRQRWLDENAARRLSARLEERTRQGAAADVGDLALEEKLLSAQQVQTLRAAVKRVLPSAPDGGHVSAASAAPPPVPTPRPTAGGPVTGAPAPTARSPSPAVPRPPAPPAARPAGPAEPIPGYRIVGKIGVGGMATVFRAEAASTGQAIALKILLPVQAQNPVSRERFVREAELLTRFDHPNIVKGREAGQASGLYFLAMDLIDGPSVQAILDRSGAVAEDLALGILLDVARALDYMEKQGFVHRDVKPGNVMLTREGAVKLCDLGFAQPIAGGGAGASDVTCGTPEYMSPEQARGQRDLDVRSDIYSLGASLYHMVLGDVPFKGTDNLDVMAKQVLAELYSPRVKNKLSRHMHYFIEKMMAKEKDVRYQSSAEVIEDIEGQIGGFRSLQYPGGAPAQSAAERLRALVAPFVPAAPPPPAPGRDAARPADAGSPTRTFPARRLRSLKESTRRFRRLS